MRAAAAEGFARLRNPADSAMIEQAWKDEGKTSPRLSLAFALVMLGRNGDQRIQPAAIPDQQSEFGRLQRRSPAVPDGTGARQQHAQGALRAA